MFTYSEHAEGLLMDQSARIAGTLCLLHCFEIYESNKMLMFTLHSCIICNSPTGCIAKVGITFLDWYRVDFKSASSGNLSFGSTFTQAVHSSKQIKSPASAQCCSASFAKLQPD